MLVRAPITIQDSASPPRQGVELRANQIAHLVGPAYQGNPGSSVRAEFLAEGATMSDLQDMVNGALDEAFADAAETTLSRYEAVYGLTPRPEWGVERRRTRVLATIRAMRGGTPQALLRALQAYDPAAKVYEVTFQDVVNAAYIGTGDPPTLDVPRVADAATYYGGYRNVWTVAAKVDVAYWTLYHDDILDVLEAAKPAHVSIQLGVEGPFLVDSSLLDRDFLT